MADEETKKGPKKTEGYDGSAAQKRFKAGFQKWLDSGQKGVFAGFGDVMRSANGSGSNGPKTPKPPIEDPPLPPTDGEDDGDTDPALARPASNSWPDIVKFHFPKGAGKYYKDGGLVRGGGKATKGRGRGRFV